MRKIEAQRPRLETGALQTEGDWAGMFIRGDDCMFLAHDLKMVIPAVIAAGYRDIPSIMRLQTLLRAIHCDVLNLPLANLKAQLKAQTKAQTKAAATEK